MLLKCNKENCNNAPTHQIVMALRVHKNHAPAISTPVVLLCDEHKNIYTKDDFFGPVQWKQICDGLTKGGYQAPNKEFSDIIVQPIPGGIN